MNYQRIYDQLIERSRARIPPEGYVEHHHIVPRCLGGTDEKENIAILTPEEHFVAHVLLVKIHPEHRKLIVAVSRMCKGKGRKRRKLYGWLKRRHSECMKERQSGKGNSQYGTMWIHRGLENKKIKKNEAIPEGWKKGRNNLKPNSICKDCGRDTGNTIRKYCLCCRDFRRKHPLMQYVSHNMKVHANKISASRKKLLSSNSKIKNNLLVQLSKARKGFIAQSSRALA